MKALAAAIIAVVPRQRSFLPFWSLMSDSNVYSGDGQRAELGFFSTVTGFTACSITQPPPPPSGIWRLCFGNFVVFLLWRDPVVRPEIRTL